MRLAVIDLGTNSIRFDIHEISVNRKGSMQTRRLYRDKAMVRLGQDLFLEGKLNLESKRRTREAIESFRDIMDVLRVDTTIAFGTAALRDASNGEQFIEEIRNKTGIDFRIITGAEEASLIAKGVLANESLPKGIFALIDIGGGSTEISICKGRQVLHSHSFNLGVAKLQQVFLKTQPPAGIIPSNEQTDEHSGKHSKKKKSKKAQKKIQIKNQGSRLRSNPVADLRSYIKSVILPVKVIEHWQPAPFVIGSSGSVLALSRLIHKDRDAEGKAFGKKELEKVVDQIKTKTPAELLSMKGMEPKRVDLILAGGILLDELAGIIGAKQFRPTEYALRDGILVDAIHRYQHRKSKHYGFSVPELERRAKAWGVDPHHFGNVKQKAEWLFDHLKKVHQLGPEWKKYLGAAAVLHDVGESISHAHHAEHSEYMVRNANFVGMHPWEANLIAALCRYHKEEKILEKKFEKKIPFDRKDELRPVFLKLLSLLMMADALDRTHKDSLKLKRVRSHGKHITLRFASRGTCDLEILRFEQRKSLFEELFHKEMVLSKI